MNSDSQRLDLLQDLIVKAKKKGATAADAVFIETKSLSVAQRLGNMEKLERSEGYDIGLRTLIGNRQAIASSSDFSPEALEELTSRAITMAKVVPEDPFCGSSSKLKFSSLELWDRG